MSITSLSINSPYTLKRILACHSPSTRTARLSRKNSSNRRFTSPGKTLDPFRQNKQQDAFTQYHSFPTYQHLFGGSRFLLGYERTRDHSSTRVYEARNPKAKSYHRTAYAIYNSKRSGIMANRLVDTICSSEAFGVVRNVSAFRLAGMTKGSF
jgi:hypothetical protein